MNEQKSFMESSIYIIINIISISLLFIIWFIVVHYEWVPYLLPPTSVIAEFIKEPGLIAHHMLATSLRALAGFAIGSMVGIVIALAMGWSRVFLAIINPFILLIKPIPVLALIPIFILWFGLGEWGKILYIALGCFFIIVVISSEAIRNVNKIYIWAGQALGCKRGAIYRRVILPSIIPGIIGGLRVAITTAFPFCIAAEFLGAQKGLGSYLIKAEVHLTISKMIAGVVAITVLVIIFDKVVRLLVKNLTIWSERENV